MKLLDFVQDPKTNYIGLVTQMGRSSKNTTAGLVRWITPGDSYSHTTFHDADDIVVIGSLSEMLSRGVCDTKKRNFEQTLLSLVNSGNDGTYKNLAFTVPIEDLKPLFIGLPRISGEIESGTSEYIASEDTKINIPSLKKIVGLRVLCYKSTEATTIHVYNQFGLLIGTGHFTEFDAIEDFFKEKSLFDLISFSTLSSIRHLSTHGQFDFTIPLGSTVKPNKDFEAKCHLARSILDKVTWQKVCNCSEVKTLYRVTDPRYQLIYTWHSEVPDTNGKLKFDMEFIVTIRVDLTNTYSLQVIYFNEDGSKMGDPVVHLQDTELSTEKDIEQLETIVARLR